MPTIRKILKAREEYKCSFCKGKIQTGERYVKRDVKDGYGKYKLAHHIECDRTVDLNASTEWGVF